MQFFGTLWNSFLYAFRSQCFFLKDLFHKSTTLLRLPPTAFVLWRFFCAVLFFFPCFKIPGNYFGIVMAIKGQFFCSNYVNSFNVKVGAAQQLYIYTPPIFTRMNVSSRCFLGSSIAPFPQLHIAALLFCPRSILRWKIFVLFGYDKYIGIAFKQALGKLVLGRLTVMLIQLYKPPLNLFVNFLQNTGHLLLPEMWRCRYFSFPRKTRIWAFRCSPLQDGIIGL